MIIMLDLDDTLLNKEGKIDEITLNYLNEIKNKHLIVFNTARALSNTLNILEIFKPHYLILNAGSTIYDSNLKLIYEDPIKNEIAKKVIKELKANNVFNIEIEYGDGFKSDNLEFIKNHNYIKYENLETFSQDVYKIVYHDTKKLLGQKIALKYNLDFTNYINSNINKISKHDKGHGLLKFKEILNIKDKIIAFGDDLGDISMLKEADIPVIMANSQPELFKYNFNQTKNNNENGIYYYLKKEGI